MNMAVAERNQRPEVFFKLFKVGFAPHAFKRFRVEALDAGFELNRAFRHRADEGECFAV